MTDYLIVGQGLAGSLLAHQLLQNGQKVLLIDGHHQGAASAVAAGIINPVTGRRFVKSWMVDQLLPQAKAMYRELERLLNVPLLYERPILRALFTTQEENNWLSRSSQLNFAPYIASPPQTKEIPAWLKPTYSWCRINAGLQVDLPRLILSYRSYLQANNCLLNETFEYAQLKICAHHISYHNIKARRIVFCEGARAVQNPFFEWLPFVLAKGEVLIIKIPGARTRQLVKYGLFVAPVEDGLYWVGSNYEWDPKDELPSTQGKEELLEKLEGILSCPFERVDHRAAIRPTTKDRRPFLGRHPAHSNLLIFNGLGTKGASLGPYWAKHLQAHLTDGKLLSKEVDIQRFDLAERQ